MQVLYSARQQIIPAKGASLLSNYQIIDVTVGRFDGTVNVSRVVDDEDVVQRQPVPHSFQRPVNAPATERISYKNVSCESCRRAGLCRVSATSGVRFGGLDLAPLLFYTKEPSNYSLLVRNSSPFDFVLKAGDSSAETNEPAESRNADTEKGADEDDQVQDLVAQLVPFCKHDADSLKLLQCEIDLLKIPNLDTPVSIASLPDLITSLTHRSRLAEAGALLNELVRTMRDDRITTKRDDGKKKDEQGRRDKRRRRRGRDKSKTIFKNIQRGHLPVNIQ